MEFIYLDNNATTRPSERAVGAMRKVDAYAWANPSSIHRPGQAARQRIELARKALAQLIGARPRQITLVGSGTEAIDLAIRGGLRARCTPRARAGQLESRDASREPISIVTTRAEHSAVRELATDLERFGLDGREVRVHWASMNADGRVDVGALQSLLASDPSIVLSSVQWANNETGTVQDVGAIGAMCRSRPAKLGGPVLFHCDATQWVGKHAVEGEEAKGGTWGKGGKGGTAGTWGTWGKWGKEDKENGDEDDAHGARASRVPERVIAPESVVPACLEPFDFLTYSPHKFHGPKGVGVLWVRPGGSVRVAPIILGEQEMGRRGGTENTSGIVGAGVAADEAREWLRDPARLAAGRGLRDRFEREVVGRCNALGVETSVNGPTAEDQRLWNTSSIAFSRLEAEALLLLLSERGVCCSAGAACSSGSLEPSSVLLATGIAPERAHGTLRFSLSRETTHEEVDRAIAIVTECVSRLRASMGAMM